MCAHFLRRIRNCFSRFSYISLLLVPVSACSNEDESHPSTVPSIAKVQPPTPPNFRFLYDRVGSEKVGGVPIEIRLGFENREYRMSIVGKDDMVGALVSGDKGSYNVALPAGDLDVLSSLREVRCPSGEPSWDIHVEWTRSSASERSEISCNSRAADLLRKILFIYNLPEYRVRRGETVAGIVAENYAGKLTLERVLEVNPGVTPGWIWPGQRLKIPMDISERRSNP